MTRFRWILAVAAVAVAFAAHRQPATSQTLDVIIRNGRVLDGSGNPFFYADIGIRGRRDRRGGGSRRAER